MSALAAAIVAMLSTLVPLLTGAAAEAIDPIINVLVALIPQIVNEVQSVGPSIMCLGNVIKGRKDVTPAQLEALAGVETQLDAAFEAAATAAGAPAP